ncbi:hypothetical protein K1719_019654 [Acacia pycnantha]|nr:hypothetical protein K1719_019654 [Acacia pycnantha]
MNMKKMFLVSLGTGFQKRDEEVRASRKTGQKVVENLLGTEVYDAKSAEKWGLLVWGAGPITEFTLDGSQDMVDYYLAPVFQTLHKSNYLRIQSPQGLLLLLLSSINIWNGISLLRVYYYYYYYPPSIFGTVSVSSGSTTTTTLLRIFPSTTTTTTLLRTFPSSINIWNGISLLRVYYYYYPLSIFGTVSVSSGSTTTTTLLRIFPSTTTSTLLRTFPSSINIWNGISLLRSTTTTTTTTTILYQYLERYQSPQGLLLLLSFINIWNDISLLRVYYYYYPLSIFGTVSVSSVLGSHMIVVELVPRSHKIVAALVLRSHKMSRHNQI